MAKQVHISKSCVTNVAEAHHTVKSNMSLSDENGASSWFTDFAEDGNSTLAIVHKIDRIIPDLKLDAIKALKENGH